MTTALRPGKNVRRVEPDPAAAPAGFSPGPRDDEPVRPPGPPAALVGALLLATLILVLALLAAVSHHERDGDVRGEGLCRSAIA